MGISKPYHSFERLVILAPNWLGDAIMALPAIADVRRAVPGASIAAAARPAIAPLFRMTGNDLNEVITIEHGLEIAGKGFDAALLLPNSFHAAWIAVRARIAERWGYRTEWRALLLTRAVEPPSGLHQVEYYQQLVHALDFPNGPIEPTLKVPPEAQEAGAQLLRQSGWDGREPLVALAPGASYGGAKRWPPASFAALADTLAADGVRCVMIGSREDARTAGEVAGASVASGARKRALLNLVGRTDLPALAGVLSACRAVVTNDSGAMHLAAAIGVAVTAVFGPTDDRATRPVGNANVVITGPAWCRPCMLRECPLDHWCMRGIEVAPVVDAARRTL
ncbi:MAG TPA: lipopolysaccharide heptosyltransferase II [Vicinamibacterales bacterium]|nr:lipopolysaccharide heptosyltransferase II [Vicinamibacterales bacterium]